MGFTSVGSPALWFGFIGFVLLMLALDLGVFHRKEHEVGFKEALTWSAVWIALALLFNLGIWWRFGAVPATEFLTGYLIEKSLSVDNIFVFVLIFGSLNIPPVYRHRVLFWGIMTALVLRAIMIFAGVAMLQRFHWLIYVFGAFLIFTGVKLVAQWGKKEEESLKENGMLRFTRRVIPSTSRLDGNRFFTIENGRRVATPLFITLILVELSDVVFALDSIPAIFGVTQDPFIVFSSNIFAILGLRSLFFALDGMLDKFYYLKLGVSAVLVFVGAKMALVDFVKISSGLSLGVIAGLLGGCVVASLIRARRLAARGQQQPLARAG